MTSVRNILLLTTEIRRVGGVESHVAELASGLRRNGYEVTTVVARSSGDSVLDDQTIVIDGLGEPSVPTPSLAALEALVRSRRPDIVHAHSVFDPDMLGGIRRLVPVLRSVHNYQGCFSSGLKYFSPGHACHRAQGPLCVAHALFRNCGHRKVALASLHRYRLTLRGLQSLREMDGVLAYSKYMLQDLARNSISKVSYAPLFISPAAPAPPHEGAPRILYVGRLVPAKGVDTLIRAVAPTDAYLDVHGGGRAEAQLKRLASRLGVATRVAFHDWSDAETLDRAYAASSLVAVPSVWPEPFGLVGLEAMARGRAVLASRTGGIPEWLADGQTGRLAPPGDVSAWTKEVRAMLNDPESCRVMGQAGRERLLEHFTFGKHLASLLPAYERACVHWKRDQTLRH